MRAWRPVPGFPGYEISDAGNVRDGAGRLLRAVRNEGGYYRVLLLGDRPVYRRVHVLVLEAFVGPRPSPRHHAAHGPDRRKSNNRLTNLRWATPEENEADKKPHGTALGGGRHWRPNRERVSRVRERAARGESYSAIALSEGLHRYSVSRIVRGLRRREVA